MNKITIELDQLAHSRLISNLGEIEEALDVLLMRPDIKEDVKKEFLSVMQDISNIIRENTHYEENRED